jgi:hypothetical protein
MTNTRKIEVEIKIGSDLDRYLNDLETKTTVSTKEILEFLINWAYEDYFYVDTENILDYLPSDKRIINEDDR